MLTMHSSVPPKKEIRGILLFISTCHLISQFSRKFSKHKLHGQGPWVMQWLKQIQGIKDAGRKFYILINQFSEKLVFILHLQTSDSMPLSLNKITLCSYVPIMMILFSPYLTRRLVRLSKTKSRRHLESLYSPFFELIT